MAVKPSRFAALHCYPQELKKDKAMEAYFFL